MFKKIVRAVFLNTCTLETENWVQNLDIHQFSYSEILIHSKRHLNGDFYMAFEENCSSYFFKKRTSES